MGYSAQVRPIKATGIANEAGCTITYLEHECMRGVVWCRLISININEVDYLISPQFPFVSLEENCK